jgi:hypothetical protein
MRFPPEYWIAYGFCSCHVRYFPATHFTATIFPDGTNVPAAPTNTDYYRGMAECLGYKTDIAACCREHEILHTFLAEAQGLPHSPLMWAIAHGMEDEIPLWQRENEEKVVMDFQRYLNGADLETLDLPPFLFSLRDRALELLRHNQPIPIDVERSTEKDD